MTLVTAAEHRRLTHAVATASDKALAGIVALLDAMADRREADRLLDAVRPRLRQLRPPRPIGLPRLLFVPLRGAITEALLWRRQDGGLPRSALLPIAGAVSAAIGAEANAIDAMIAGRNFADLRTVDAAGRRFWRAAAGVAAGLAQPDSWETTGLNAAGFQHVMTIAAGVCRHADPLWAAILAHPWGRRTCWCRTPSPPPLRRARWCPRPSLRPCCSRRPSQAARRRPLPPRASARPGRPSGCSIAGSMAATRTSRSPTRKARPGSASRQPDRRRRIAALRRDVGEACRNAFTDGATIGLLEPLARSGAPPTDEAMEAMETKARALRRLEQAGRQLVGGPTHDAVLRRIVDGFGMMRAAPGANPADLASLTEILAGPEAALRLLDAA